jgi:hypothetical protein
LVWIASYLQTADFRKYCCELHEFEIDAKEGFPCSSLDNVMIDDSSIEEATVD